MPLALGLDTGGTYTDAVILETDTTQVLAKAKAPTTHEELAIGMAQALQRLPEPLLAQVQLVALSTTLATNASVEGKGGPVGVLLIGYDEGVLERFQLRERIPAQQVRFIRGGHDVRGNEREPLDRAGVQRAAAELRPQVESLAVSGYFSVLNPAHEQQARELIRAEWDLPIVCGHELTSQLDSVKRAATAALNARLIPLTARLLAATKAVLAQHRIDAPLVVVRGDGSLMTEAMARERPIETILSGPAASAVGGYVLSHQESALVVDMGGTTTDIALLMNGRPKTDPRGATVGAWRTCVSAADIWTAGLGGDSQLTLAPKNGHIHIGPRRVVPLCMAASQHPEITPELRRLHQAGASSSLVQVTDFFRLNRLPANDLALSEKERHILTLLQEQPRSLLYLAQALALPHPRFLGVERLEAQGILTRIGLTPTDLLHVRGDYQAWETEAARLGTEIFIREVGWEVEEFVDRALEALTDQIALQILGKLTADYLHPQPFPHCEVCQALALSALRGDSRAPWLSCELKLNAPLIGLGAPAETFLKPVGRKLRAQVVIPEHAEVANAIGAVSGSVTLRLEAHIFPLHSPAGVLGYRVHLPDGKTECLRLEDAVALATARLETLVAERSRAAGADFHVRIVREDQEATVAGDHGLKEERERLLLETKLVATAVGRPRMAGD